MKQDGCGMWAPHELYFEPTAVDPATEPTPIKCKIVAVEAGNLAGYALDGECLSNRKNVNIDNIIAFGRLMIILCMAGC